MDGYITTMYQPHRRRVHLSESIFLLDGLDTYLVGFDTCQSGCCASLVTSRPSQAIHIRVQIPRWTTSIISWLCVKSVRFGYACSDWSKDNNWIHKMVFCHFASIHCMSAGGCSYPDSSICHKKKKRCYAVNTYSASVSWHNSTNIIWADTFELCLFIHCNEPQNMVFYGFDTFYVLFAKHFFRQI